MSWAAYRSKDSHSYGCSSWTSCGCGSCRPAPPCSSSIATSPYPHGLFSPSYYPLTLPSSTSSYSTGSCFEATWLYPATFSHLPSPSRVARSIGAYVCNLFLLSGWREALCVLGIGCCSGFGHILMISLIIPFRAICFRSLMALLLISQFDHSSSALAYGAISSNSTSFPYK